MSLAIASLDALKSALGPRGWSEDKSEIAPHLNDWRGQYRGRASLLLKPASVEEVSAVVALANARGLTLVPQGGNTGLVRGGVPDESGGEILVNLGRMNRIRGVDAANFSLVAEAGVALQRVQEAASEAGRLFPLSLGAEGTATVGGIVSTNAGGVHVLKYGTTRALTLGLEAVLPTGEIYRGLTALRKDNTGYDLKSLLVGAEGTLGIVTAAALQLFPALKSQEVAFLGVPSPQAAVDLLGLLREATGDRVIAFELIARFGLELVTRHIEGGRDPLAAPHPWYVLVEIASSETGADLKTPLETGLARAAEAGLLEDGVIAASLDQARRLWHMRHALSEAQKPEGGAIKHDISLPVSAIPAFLAQAAPAAERIVPGLRPLAFGHVGDGNLHFDLLQPEGMDRAAYLAHMPAVNRAVHDIVADLGGSISAEHGIGRQKVSELARLKDPAALAAMRAIKQALDPKAVLNPGRIFRG